MSKVLLSITLSLALLFFTSQNALAIYDPVSVPNNSFGIHIANIQDLEDAAKLVNSEGGDWGYVTFVITKGERDVNRWQKVFDEMRTLHLIPIVRVATAFSGENWEKPSFGEIDGWVSFLDSLNWVIKNRYLVINNEVNSGKEWGGEVNPEEYASYLKTFTQELKNANDDFFVLPAGFDASLPTSRNNLDEAIYLKRMLIKEPDIFDLVDGWASHSYPNPNFSGSVYATGKGTIRTFAWELSFLKKLGVKKELPVFITETGWTRKVGESQIGEKFENAFLNAWKDKRIVAVTPFILNYEYPPFDIFSWKNNGSYNNLYNQVQKLPKNPGKPRQENSGVITQVFVPSIWFAGSSFSGILFVKNTGQSIWSAKDITISSPDGGDIKIEKTSFVSFEPGSSGLIFIQGQAPLKGGLYIQKIFLVKDNLPISNEIEIKSLTITLPLWHSDMEWKLRFGKI